MFNIMLYVYIIFNQNMYDNNIKMSHSFNTIGRDYYNNISESNIILEGFMHNELLVDYRTEELHCLTIILVLLYIYIVCVEVHYAKYMNNVE